MRASTGNLAPYLAGIIGKTISPETVMADCFTFTMQNGNQYYYTNADYPVAFYNYDSTNIDSGLVALGELGSMQLGQAGESPLAVFLANSVRVSGLKYSCKIGVDVDEQDVTISCAAPPYFPQSSSAADSGVLGAGELGSAALAAGPYTGPAWGPSAELIEGVPFLTALREGLFDYATLQRDRAFLPCVPQGNAPAVPIGTTTLFYGLISDIESIGRTEAKVKVKSLLVRLSSDFPRKAYQPSCPWILYGPGCTLTKSAFGHTGTAGSGSTAAIVYWTNPLTAPQPNQGTMTFTSGALNGYSAQINTSTSTASYIRGQLPVAPQPGDTFTAYPGCDHTLALASDGSPVPSNTGCAFFNNAVHFGGFPRVPPPATSY